MSKVEVLDETSNAVVAKHADREFPGVLLQGDTLRILFTDLVELKEEIDAKDFEAAGDIADSLKEQLELLLDHYERILKEHDIRLPYAKP